MLRATALSHLAEVYTCRTGDIIDTLCQPGGRRLTEREVAGHALGGTKEWTDASKAAFAALLGRPIDQVLDKADHDIRVRGPLWWTVGETAADARRGYPWVGLPSGGIHAMGNVQHDARGALVIENADTFQQVCMHCPEVTGGYASGAKGRPPAV
jgi:hypothetical protein